jgi:hypothetical protein
VAINLNVPLVAQLNADMSWHASACMVNFYFRPGPRFWAPDQEGAGGVVHLEEFDLARRQGLVSVNYTGKWEAKFIETMLNTRGPMWCIGNWYGPVHVIVLTGVDKDRIYFNDPVEPTKKAEKVSWFNEHLRPQANSVMVKDPSSL